MTNLQNTFRRFLKESRAVAAIEFALVMPVLILMTLGGYASYDLVLTDRAVNRSSSIVADLTSRSETVDEDYGEDLIEIGRSLIGDPANNNARYDISITSISNTFDSDSNYELVVNWSVANKSNLELEDEDIENYELPFIPEGESVILVDLKLRYETAIYSELFGTMELNEVEVRRPRFVTMVPFEN